MSAMALLFLICSLKLHRDVYKFSLVLEFRHSNVEKNNESPSSQLTSEEF